MRTFFALLTLLSSAVFIATSLPTNPVKVSVLSKAPEITIVEIDAPVSTAVTQVIQTSMR